MFLTFNFLFQSKLGHEPMAPFPSKTIFGKEKLFYPNSFNYLKHVYTLDGFTGLYRGLSMKIISTTVGNVVSHKVAKVTQFPFIEII